MNKSLSLIIFFVGFLFIQSQELVQKKYSLSPEINENSGLLFFNGKIITHNDSGGQPILYQLNYETGTIERRVKISNAFNIDWEDITQDETHIYISDSGNNRGNRTNIKIYKISKKDFMNSETVIAKTIFYNYDNQKNFNSSSKNNFDAEALISYHDKLLIFSKNRGNNKTKIYELTKNPGNQSAKYLYTLDIDGQITGATKNDKDDVVLSGYTASLSPFVVILKEFKIGDRSFTRIDFSQFIGIANQMEGVTFVNENKLVFSREKFKKKIADFSINKPASVFATSLDKLIHWVDNNSNTDYQIERVTTDKGKTVLKKIDSIDFKQLKELPAGIYYTKLMYNPQLTINKELVVE